MGNVSGPLQSEAPGKTGSPVSGSFEASRLLNTILSITYETIFIVQEGLIKFATGPACFDLSGFSEEAIEGKPIADIIHPDDLHLFDKYYSSALPEISLPVKCSSRVLVPGGETKWVEMAAGRTDWDGNPAVVAIITNFSNKKAKAKSYQETLISLRRQLDDNRHLLREAYHRVKNNLAAVVGLLEMGRRSSGTEPTTDLISDLIIRTKALATAQDLLAQSNNFRLIRMPHYLGELVTNSLGVFDPAGSVKIDMDIENVEFDPETAIACGMLVSELVTNSIRHAFRPSKDGPRSGEWKLEIGLSCKNENCTLKVSDNGTGLPEGFDWESSPSTGMQIIRMLAVHQLQGTLSGKSQPGNGTTWNLSFQVPRNRKGTDRIELASK
jgi:PAS domain S-box-containing protein